MAGFEVDDGLRECFTMYEDAKRKSFPSVVDIEVNVTWNLLLSKHFFFANRSLSLQELVSLILKREKQVLLIDCREEEEQEVSVIPGHSVFGIHFD